MGLLDILTIYIVVSIVLFILGYFMWVDNNIDSYQWVGTSIVWPLFLIKFLLKSIRRVLL